MFYNLNFPYYYVFDFFLSVNQLQKTVKVE